MVQNSVSNKMVIMAICEHKIKQKTREQIRIVEESVK